MVLYCVSVESGSSENCEFHLRAYVEFHNKYLLSELNQIVTVRNIKRVISYILKEDNEVYFNCKISDLSFNYQAYYYLSKMSFFDYNHFFVKTNRSYYKFLQPLYQQINNKYCIEYCYIGPIVLPDVPWAY